MKPLHGFSPIRRHHAFTSSELILFVALVVMVTLIVLPLLKSASSTTRTVEIQRQAKYVASVYATASAAGVNFLAPGDLDQTIANIVVGDTVRGGLFAGEYYGFPELAPEVQEEAKNYLRLEGRELVFNREGF